MENEKLCFVKYVGKNIDEENIYEFLFTDDIDECWGTNYEYSPSNLCNELIPNEGSYNLVKTVTSNLTLGLIQNSGCHSMQDCMDGIIALAYEDISDYDEYPEEGRLVLSFGEDYDDVEYKLLKKNVIMKDKKEEEDE